MNSSNDMSNTILQTSEFASQPIISSVGETNNSMFSYLKNINLTTWLIIIFILAFLGFNIFVYLAKGTQTITDIFAPLVKKIFGVSLAVTSDIVDTSAEGAKTVVNKTAGIIDTSLTAVQNITPNLSSSQLKSTSVQQAPNVAINNSLNKSLNTAQHNKLNDDYQANEAESTVNNTGKAGWCYVGTDREFRSCAEVGVNDTCMSGDIFPSKEICINPSLRV
jgi:hypothetical protein